MFPRHGGATDIGRLRKLNEDSYGVHLPTADEAALGCLYVVADGVGGEAAGEAASRLAVETAIREYYAWPEPDPLAALRHAVELANAAVYASASSDRRATTLVAAAVVGETLHVASVGDSRLYLVRMGRLRQVTQDHSWVQEQVRAGTLDPGVARSHPLGNVITRWLGQPSVEPDLFALPLEEGDRIVICSDGLVHHVEDDTIADIVGRLEPEPAASRLVELANDGGGTDNITVVVVAIGKDRPPSDTHSLPVVDAVRSPGSDGDAARIGPAMALAGRQQAMLLMFVILAVALAGVVGLILPRIPLSPDVSFPVDGGPTALAVSADGALFVGDRAGTVRIYDLGLDGPSTVLPDMSSLLGLPRPSAKAAWSAAGPVAALATWRDVVHVAVGDRVVVYSRYGTLLRDSPTSLDGLLGQRRALAVDRDGRVYIADGARVLRLDAEGRLDPTWSVGSRVDLRAPSALAIAPDGGLYVADADGARVVRLDPSGDLAQSWTSAGATSLVSPQTLVVSSDGRLFVADVGLRRVLELSDAGGRQPFQREELGDPLPLAMDGAGNLYVGNASTGRVSAVRPGGWFFRLPFGR